MTETGEGLFAEQRKEESLQLRNELKARLAQYHLEHQIPLERQTRQIQIIDQLPDDFWMLYKGRLISKDYEEAIYEHAHTELAAELESPSPPIKEIVKNDPVEVLSRIGVGELFENIVRVDKNICHAKETAIGEALRNIMTNPRRFAIPWLSKYLRNPDLAIVKEDGSIGGWVECKAGLIDDYAADQLSETGFKNAFERVLKNLSMMSPSDLRKHGLDVLGAHKERLFLSSRPEMILAIPYQESKKDIIDFFRNEIALTKRWRASRYIRDNYAIKQSPFSREELGAMNSLLVKKFSQEQGIGNN